MAAKKRRKKTSKRIAKKSRKKSSTIPLEVLEKRLVHLNNLVARRGGDSF